MIARRAFATESAFTQNRRDCRFAQNYAIPVSEFVRIALARARDSCDRDSRLIEHLNFRASIAVTSPFHFMVFIDKAAADVGTLRMTFSRRVTVVTTNKVKVKTIRFNTGRPLVGFSAGGSKPDSD